MKKTIDNHFYCIIAIFIAFLSSILNTGCGDKQCLKGNCIDGLWQFESLRVSNMKEIFNRVNIMEAVSCFSLMEENIRASFQVAFRHGYGVMTYNDGSRYTGQWKDGLRHGKGITSHQTGYPIR